VKNATERGPEIRFFQKEGPSTEKEPKSPAAIGVIQYEVKKKGEEILSESPSSLRSLRKRGRHRRRRKVQCVTPATPT